MLLLLLLLLLLARWAARLSALLIRGNALVLREVLPRAAEQRVGAGQEAAGFGGLPEHLPEGDSVYELLVR